MQPIRIFIKRLFNFYLRNYGKVTTHCRHTDKKQETNAIFARLKEHKWKLEQRRPLASIF